jgi:hypothetical protein
MLEWLGWIATAVFVGSYWFRGANATRIAQAVGACLWIGYGVMLGARPVILANVLVAGGALLSFWRERAMTVTRLDTSR